MRYPPTYFLTELPITGTIAKKYPLAVETCTRDEYVVVVEALEKRYGVSKIQTLFDLTDLSDQYAVLADTYQYLIFMKDTTVRDYAQTVLFNLAKNTK
jgi:hypothetical protein